jgi:cell division protease FtsH
MPELIFAVLLMAFLLWSYGTLVKNFGLTSTAINANESSSKISDWFFIKRLIVTIVLFASCYTFISFVIAVNQPSSIENETPSQDAYNLAQDDRNSKKAEPYLDENELRQIMPDKGKDIKIIPANQIKTKFSDIAGLSEAKDEVQDIVSFLRDPVGFSRLGAKSPKGILLYGEPGTGKTLMARAIAGEAQVAFIAVSGSEFDQEYVGVGAARVRQLFEFARNNAPCIIFIDEIDTLAHKRHSHDPGWLSQTTNQLLAEMDGLDDLKNQGIVVIGASNRMDSMDPAVLRPGRLDRHIKLDIPTLSERAEVLNIYMRKITVSKDVKAETIAKMTPGFSSAELANLVNEATIIATKQNKKAVELKDFDAAKDRVILGSKRDALKVTEKTRRITAYHEAGHALIGHVLGANHNPIYKVTITPRGPSLGHTSFEPSDEEHSLNLNQIEAMIAMQLAGRIAEELLLGEQNVTTGAENDLKQATQLAYNMVTRWGYSKRVGPIYYGKSMDFIPKAVIEQEVQAIITRNYARAKEILIANRTKLDRLANALLEHETLDANQVKAIVR